MSDLLDMTIAELGNYTSEIIDSWNGDEPGELERRASIADEIFKNLAKINALYKELEG